MFNNAEYEMAIATISVVASLTVTLSKLNPYIRIQLFTLERPDVAMIDLFRSALFNIYGILFFSSF